MATQEKIFLKSQTSAAEELHINFSAKKKAFFFFFFTYLISRVPSLSCMNGKTHLKLLQTNKE